jgi:hypothetical protein
MASSDFNVLVVVRMQIFNIPYIAEHEYIEQKYKRTTEPRMRKHANVGVSRANIIRVPEPRTRSTWTL